ncbi:MAG: MEMO1 family protein [Candidatus Micrarchaeota archaeon]|nr:MEMO1 family protein [Candidatus Micrarchaeota archaeon]
MNIRKAAVAGTFYPSSRNEVEKIFNRFFTSKEISSISPLESAIGIISPHAGYIYSGKTASYGYARLRKIGKGATFVILGPNHYGVGPEVSIYPKGEWETPLGNAVIDEEFVDELCKICNGGMFLNASAHLYEHSIEVQIPFLQYLFKNDFKFVPVCMLNQSLNISNELSKLLYDLYSRFEKKGKRIFFIASSDFSHYVPKERAEKLDSLAIEAIKSLDVKRFYDVIERNDISLCGYGPISTLMSISKKIGVKEINLLRYSTSAETTGDESSVVGYASIEFFR